MAGFNLTDAGMANRTCFSCSLDFRYTAWDGDNACLGWAEQVATDYLVVSRGFVQNGILLLLARSCTDSCAAYCKSTGFGVTKTTCNHCCEEDGCNDSRPTLSATGQ
ncbi:uncharacterized protein LOC119106914 [Pollicipes pollicipes]|uniref:uncharacterized protein LOC119106914 n=1 Tax=Pollicipes pollicipes TaxID=41117 RepID=UPI00188500CB|nr:uncharacterized protein LOC119106914 [Pollicipes pollicipes]